MRPKTRFCSSACRQRAYRERQGSKIPAELRSRDQWVTWRPVRRGGKTTKVPTRPDGSAASSTDPATWSPYAAVRSAQRKGVVLDGGIVCIDLDDCLVDGELVEWARAIVEAMPDTYIEISPSGRGLHIWGYGDVPRGRRIRDGRSVEVYSSGRYICVTGDRFDGAPGTLADLSEVVSTLIT